MGTRVFWSEPKLILSLAVSPAMLLGLSFLLALAITEFLVPGTTGSEALAMSAVLLGLAGGFLMAKINTGYAIQSAVISASFATLLYVSLRMFWFDAPLTLASAGFSLIVPAALVGGLAARNR